MYKSKIIHIDKAFLEAKEMGKDWIASVFLCERALNTGALDYKQKKQVKHVRDYRSML